MDCSVGQAWVCSHSTAGASHPPKGAAQGEATGTHRCPLSFLALDLSPYEQSTVRKSWTWALETRAPVLTQLYSVGDRRPIPHLPSLQSLRWKRAGPGAECGFCTRGVAPVLPPLKSRTLATLAWTLGDKDHLPTSRCSGLGHTSRPLLKLLQLPGGWCT